MGLGSSVDPALLQAIADGTGGTFFWVADADGLQDAYERIGGDLGAPDSDGDGLSDEAETTGWRTHRGQLFVTDPHDPDTDDDGLTDGEEAGSLWVSPFQGKTAYTGVSNPRKVDTDDDGLDDWLEVTEGTGPFTADSDRDGLDDLTETEAWFHPTDRNPDMDSYPDQVEFRDGSDPYAFDLNGAENGAALIGGAIFGEWDWGAEHIGRFNATQRESMAYLSGMLLSGLIAIGDIRDIPASVGKGAWGDAALSAVGIVPLVGDAAKTGVKIWKFAEKGKKATQSAVFRIARDSGPFAERRAELRRLILDGPDRARLPQDVGVRGRNARTPNAGRRPDGTPVRISKDAAQAAALAAELRRLEAAGANNIRVNQRQVDVDGLQVGLNRPDLQYNYQGKHYVVEWDRPLRPGSEDSARGLAHYARILANDPDLPEDRILILTVGAPER